VARSQQVGIVTPVERALRVVRGRAPHFAEPLRLSGLLLDALHDARVVCFWQERGYPISLNNQYLVESSEDDGECMLSLEAALLLRRHPRLGSVAFPLTPEGLCDLALRASPTWQYAQNALACLSAGDMAEALEAYGDNYAPYAGKMIRAFSVTPVSDDVDAWLSDMEMVQSELQRVGL
jgi:hypothetical protein